VFSEVTRTGRRPRLIRRVAFVIGSTAVQVLVVVSLVLAAGRPRAGGRPGPVVEVRLVRAPRAGPSSPGLAAPRRAADERPRGAKKPVSTAMVQPKAVPGNLPPPEPAEVPPPAPAPAAVGAGSEGPGGTPEGIVGGAPGGEGGAAAGAVPEPPARVDFSEEMTPPRLLEGPILEYTPEALDHRVEGLMIVRCVVTAEGVVHECRVLRGLPFMDRAVVAVLEGRRYAPATLNGRPLEVNYTFRIKLRLPG